MKHTPGPSDWLKEKWTVGQYTPTQTFKEITNHSCVCRKDDMGLVALFGPADDLESQRMADLFSAAPEMLEALKSLVGRIEGDGSSLEMANALQWSAYRQACEAIAKAEGK